MDPIEIYLSSMKSICSDFIDADFSEFKDKLIVKNIKEKEKFFSENQKQTYIAFVVSGLARAYYIDSLGSEKTAWFIPEYHYITDYPSFLNESASNYYFDAIEPTTIVILTKENMQAAYKKSEKFERYGRIIAEEILTYMQTRIESFLFKSATERYIDFITKEKDLLNRISISHLSSYLGIERQSLTRIRKQLIHK